MPPDTHGSNISKRRRIVEGSCWPCRHHRVECDLGKPLCRRCVANRSEGCSYERVLLRWKQSAAKGFPAVQPAISDGLLLESASAEPLTTSKTDFGRFSRRSMNHVHRQLASLCALSRYSKHSVFLQKSMGPCRKRGTDSRPKTCSGRDVYNA